MGCLFPGPVCLLVHIGIWILQGRISHDQHVSLAAMLVCTIQPSAFYQKRPPQFTLPPLFTRKKPNYYQPTPQKNIPTECNEKTKNIQKTEMPPPPPTCTKTPKNVPKKNQFLPQPPKKVRQKKCPCPPIKTNPPFSKMYPKVPIFTKTPPKLTKKNPPPERTKRFPPGFLVRFGAGGGGGWQENEEFWVVTSSNAPTNSQPSN